jgi:hypothetical protein
MRQLRQALRIPLHYNDRWVVGANNPSATDIPNPPTHRLVIEDNGDVDHEAK